MMLTFFKMMRSIHLRSPVIIYCIGAMGSGKTTLALLGYLALTRYKNSVSLHYYNGGECGYECLNYAIIDVRNDDINSISYIVFDDYSFVLQSKTKEYYDFLNTLFRIRHLTGKNKIVIWFNGHYSRALAPFIRATNYRVLTSISPAEVKQYSSDYLFRVEDLWEYYNHYVTKPSRHIVLLEFRGISKIIDVTLKDPRIKKELQSIYNNIYESMRSTMRSGNEDLNLQNQSNVIKCNKQ